MRIAPFLILAFASQFLHAQDKLLPVFHFNRLTTAEGLPTNEIRSNVVRDRAGFIWVGTANGLARYDGYSCKVYRNKTGDPYSLSSNSVITLFVDTKGRLWVGTYASGLSLYDPMRDRFVNFLPRRNDSLWYSGHYVASFMEESTGRIWMGFADGQVVRLDLGPASSETDPDSISRHARFRTINDSRFKGWVEKVVPWDDRSILVSSGGGLFLVNRETGDVSRPHLPPVNGLDLDTVAVPVLYRESAERLWIGTVLRGLYLFNCTRGSLTYFRKGPEHGEPPDSGRIQELQHDSHGRLWIATGNGVDLFDPRSGTYKEFLTSWGAPGKSSFTRMSLDSAGTLWISTMDDGIYFLPPASFRFPHYALRAPSGRPMEMETINLWRDGSYWIGTEGKVANIQLENLSVVHIVDLFKGKKSGYGRAGAWTSLDDKKGALWFGTWGLGLYSFEPRTGRVRNFRISDQLKDLPLNQDVCIGLLERTADTLWIGANNDGLLAFDVRTHRFSKVPDVSMAQPWHLETDTSGKIWVTDQFLGVFVFNPDSTKWDFLEHDETNPGSLSNSIPERVYRDPAGRMWIGSKDLTLWEPERRSFRVIANATFADAFRARPIGSDFRGRLWVDYGGKGLSILDPTSNVFVNFDYSDGLIQPISMESLRDGRVMLVGFNGMIVVHPDSLFAPGSAPRLVLTKMQINDTTNVSPYGLTASPIRLRHDQNVLEFEFAAIDPGQAHLVEYRFRLEGLEESWVQPGSRRFVRYPGLAPGDYVFRVKAVSVYGRWPDQEIAVAVSIATPWWQTSWFRLLVLMSLLGLAAIMYRRKVARLRREKRLQQEFSQQQILFQETERKRIASEIHDGLGQDLLIAQNELQQILQEKSRSQSRLKQVAGVIQQSIESAREISSNLHPHHLDRLGLCSAVRALARTSAHSSGILIEAACENMDGLLPKDAELHLYRIIQEALANAVRHAAAKHIRVELTKDVGILQAVIRDDGIGFDHKDASAGNRPDAPEAKRHGFGLSSMAERARMIGGSITIDSYPGKGTTITIRTPCK